MQFPGPSPDKSSWPWLHEPVTESLTYATNNSGSMPRISIVTPSFNQGNYFEETIRSILLQGYPNLEYIIIDGGSNDQSVNIIRKYEPWLAYWVSEPDNGQSHAINKGFTRCTGDIITFLSADDLYLPGALHDVASRWNTWKNYGLISGSWYFIDEKSNPLNEQIHKATLPGQGPYDLSTGVPYRIHQVATFFNTEMLDHVGRYVREDLKYTMDRELLFRVCKNFPVYLVNQPYGAFRLHPKSKSLSSTLAFSQEFSRLHLMYCDGNKINDRRRKRAANQWIAKGNFKFADSCDSLLQALPYMIKALIYQPGYLMQRRYYARWFHIFQNLSVFSDSKADRFEQST